MAKRSGCACVTQHGRKAGARGVATNVADLSNGCRSGIITGTRRQRMSDVLVRIKRAMIEGRYRFTEKAQTELEADGLTELDVVEAILNAVAIYKIIRSRSTRRGRAGEKLYVIQATNLTGIVIYTKGKFGREDGQETYYVLISSKRAL